MSRLKKDVLKIIRAMPEDCTTEDIHFYLHVFEKVQRRFAASMHGEVIALDDAEQSVARWLDELQ